MPEKRIIVLTNVEIDFATLVKPQAINNQGEPKYSCVVIWNQSDADNRTKVENGIKDALARGVEKGLWKKDFKLTEGARGYPIHNGNDKPEYPEWAGKYYLNAKSSVDRPPRVIDMARTDLVQADLADGGHRIHSGMTGVVSVEFFPYSNSGNKGIGVSLRCVLKQGEGVDRTQSSANAEDDFKEILDTAEVTVADLVEDDDIPF